MFSAELGASGEHRPRKDSPGANLSGRVLSGQGGRARLPDSVGDDGTRTEGTDDRPWSLLEEADDRVRPTSRRPASDQGSPPRGRPGTMMVDIETLKGLFTEQSATLLEHQRKVTEETLRGLRQEMQQSETRVRQEVKHQSDEIAGLKDANKDIVKRLEALESQPSSTASTTLGDGVAHPEKDKHKFTLVFGGWPRETRRASWTNCTRASSGSTSRTTQIIRGSPPVRGAAWRSCPFVKGVPNPSTRCGTGCRSSSGRSMLPLFFCVVAQSFGVVLVNQRPKETGLVWRL